MRSQPPELRERIVDWGIRSHRRGVSHVLWSATGSLLSRFNSEGELERSEMNSLRLV